jgi:hypothetical protein
MKTQKRRSRKKKTRKIKGLTRCPGCMKNGKDVRLALETKNLIKSIKKSPIHSLLTVGNEILSLPSFKKQKQYIDKLERRLCNRLKKFNITC